MHKGTAMMSDIKVTQTVPIINGRNPKSPFIGDQMLLLRIVHSDSVAIKGSDLILNPIKIANITNKQIPSKTPDRFLITLSLFNL